MASLCLRGSRMSTTVSFQTMLNQYLPNELLKEELVKRDWILNNAEWDESWLGGDLVVPFKGTQASSVSFGSLTAQTDIAQDGYVRGVVSGQPEVWGSLIFNHTDLMRHNKLSEQNFLKILPDTVDDFIDYMKQCVSLSFLNGSAFDTLATDGTSGGNFTATRPERYVIGQKVYFYNATAGLSAAGYVQTINMDTALVNVATTRAGGANLDISAYTVAQGTKVYFDGSQANPLTSLKSSLLSAANGGSTSLYGQTKTAYPYLQAIQVDGSATTAQSILNDIFNGYTKVKNRGKGNPNKVILSYNNLGYVMALLEAQKGAFHADPKGTKVNAFGWTEITVWGVKGSLDLVAIQECDDDYMMFLDLRAFKIYSNGAFRKRVNPDGREYFEIRATSGYQYIVDVCFFGDLILHRPSYCGIMCNLAISGTA